MNKKLIEHDRLYRNTQCSCLYPVLIHDNNDVYRCQECGGWRRIGYAYVEDVDELSKELQFWRITAIVFILISILYLFISEMTISTIKKIGGEERYDILLRSEEG